MELLLFLILVVMVIIALQLKRIVTISRKVAFYSETTVKCLDTHEGLLKILNDEVEKQGADIDSINTNLINR
ncbi:Uncharacterised protein [Yersinia enterocolitica]|nr:Uncharacterised protein [Yersinia enterocolitica]